MDYLTEEQTMLQDMVLRFIDENYGFEQRKAALAEASFSAAAWSQFAELGWLGVPFDEGLGGFGGGMTELAVVMRALGTGLVVEPYLETVILGGGIVASHADPMVRDELLGQLIGGELQLAAAFAEPQSRFDLHDVETRASATATGYQLNGRKSVVFNAPNADYFIVSARSAGGSRDEQGISLFLVPATAAGLRRSTYRTNDDHIAGDLTLSEVQVDGDALLGELGDGWAILDEAVDRATVALCAEALGAMDTIMEMCTEYLNTRVQFSKPIGKNQALQFRMVEMFYAREECRSLVAHAVNSIEGDAATRRAATSAAKVKIGESARFIGQQGVQLHGAIGMTEDFAVGHYYKRLESIRVMFGDPEHHLPRYGRWSAAQNVA